MTHNLWSSNTPARFWLCQPELSQECWNVAISLVWFPGGRRPHAGNYFRPLFPVASNGTFLVDREARP